MWQVPPCYLAAKAANRHLPSLAVSSSALYNARRVLIFAPWCDQGLGIQAKAYMYWLPKCGLEAWVYACVPAKQSGPRAPARMQANADEWTETRVLYNTEHTRETLPAPVLTNVISEHGITDVLLLEVCHRNIFVLAAAIKPLARVWAVPNVEMLRRGELSQLGTDVFTGILCNNVDTYNNLTYFKMPRLRMFPFALAGDTRAVPQAALHVPNTPVKFLLVGGMNVERRKQASKVIKAFTQAFKNSSMAHLTVLSQGVDWVTAPRTPHNITAIVQHMSYEQILEYYAQHHIVVACSRAEGIGLAFYEAMRAQCAVLTLNTAMYKERVVDNVNGWLLRAEAESGIAGAAELGNPDPIVRTYTFNVPELQALFTRIVASENVAQCQSNARRSYDTMCDAEKILQNYSAALQIVV